MPTRKQARERKTKKSLVEDISQKALSDSSDCAHHQPAAGRMSRKTFAKKEKRDTTAVKSAGRNDLMQSMKAERV